jgi:hypothetical protein
MSNNLDLNPHSWQGQLIHPNASQNGLVIRHPLLHIAYASYDGLLVDVGKIQLETVYLAPTLSAGMSECMLDIAKGLVNFVVDIFMDFAGFGVPTSC